MFGFGWWVAKRRPANSPTTRTTKPPAISSHTRVGRVKPSTTFTPTNASEMRTASLFVLSRSSHGRRGLEFNSKPPPRTPPEEGSTLVLLDLPDKWGVECSRERQGTRKHPCPS